MGKCYWKFGKEAPCCTVKESLAESCPTIIWKAELVNGENGHLSERISSIVFVKGMTWFLLTAHCRMREERDRLMEELLNKNESRT